MERARLETTFARRERKLQVKERAGECAEPLLPAPPEIQQNWTLLRMYRARECCDVIVLNSIPT